MGNPLTALSLDQLRTRSSVKWRMYDPDVLPLWVAEMDTPLAPPIAEELHRAVAAGDTGYAVIDGLADAYAAYAADRFGWQIDPQRMSLVPDVLQGLVNVLRLVTEVGDEVLVNTPAYPPFFAFLNQAGRRVVQSPLDADLRPDLDDLQRHFAAGVRVYLLCNPHNPTGTVLRADELVAIADLAERYGVRMLVDEIHSPLTYPDLVHTPFLTLDSPSAQRAFVFVSASKAWNLAGLKAALAISGPDAAAEHAEMPVEVAFGASILGVRAGVVAFSAGRPWLSDLMTGLDSNRRLLGERLAKRLPEVGYRMPDATFLAWLDCRALGLGDDPSATFLSQARVAVNPGPTFGQPGNGFVRLNLATRPDIIEEAVDRIADVLER